MKTISIKTTVLGLVMAMCGLALSSARKPLYPSEHLGVGITGSFAVPFSQDKSSLWTAGTGLSVEARIIGVLGLETGVRKLWVKSAFYLKDGAPGPLPVCNFVELPVSVKIYTRIINFSAGAVFGFCTDNDAPDDSDYTGLTFRISKDIQIYKGLVFEPGLLVNPILWGDEYFPPHGDVSVGLEVKFKYRF